ncbi:hypothetical protein ACEPAH_3535 [Sanghuangporus vaninii]
MTPYNISVVKPDDEEPSYNALQLQPSPFAFGHQTGPSPYVDAHIASSGRAGSYPHISTSGFVNNPFLSHSHFTHPIPTPNQSLTHMQSGDTMEPDETHRYPRVDGTIFTAGQQPVHQSPHTYHAWSAPSNFASMNASPNLMSGSPISQGTSPLTPDTPLSTVEASSTVSSLPSPGSQGSNEVYYLAASPDNQPSTLATPTELQDFHVGNVYSRHSGSETQLSVPQTVPGSPYPPYEYPGAASGLIHPLTLTRRHSHTALTRPQSNPLSAGHAPYTVHPQSPARIAGRNNPFTQVELIARLEYRFENWFLPGPLVPQTTYLPQTASDRRRYVDGFPLQAPIYFKRTASQGSPEIGITLVECVTQRFKSLEGCDDELLETCGPSISIRLNWVGYKRSWSRQIPTKNFKVPPGPITRKNLAKNIAKTVQRFIDDHISVLMEPGADSRWAVGPGRIVFSDLVLLSIHHVSKGSWQANLCLNQPLEQILSRSSLIPHSS